VFNYRFHLPIALTSLWCLSACQSGSPQAGGSSAVAAPAGWTAPAVASDKAVSGWVAKFGSAELSALVREAMAANPTLQEAAARLRSARWRAIQQGAERFPDLAARLGAGEDFSKAPPDLRSWQSESRFDLALNFAWEVDVWGRVRDQSAAAALLHDAAKADFQAARLSLAANTAKAWGNAVETTQLAALAGRTVENFEKSLASLVSRINNGVPGVTALDEKLSRANLASARSQLAAAQRREDAARRSLETVAGRYPAGKITPSVALPNISQSVPAGLPAQLLLRRPDLRAAEIRAAAQQKEVSASWKQLLPALRLTSSLGTSSAELQDILDPQRLVASIAGALGQPIFQGGRLKAEARIAESERDALASRYADTALQAFREVETALAAEVYLRRQVEALREFAKQSREAETMAQLNYEKAQVTFVTVLEAQRRAVDSQEALIQAENARIQNRIDLHLALGGDWE
jgi:outer membrane protein, multidrug efflux system